MGVQAWLVARAPEHDRPIRDGTSCSAATWRTAQERFPILPRMSARNRVESAISPGPRRDRRGAFLHGAMNIRLPRNEVRRWKGRVRLLGPERKYVFKAVRAAFGIEVDE